MNLTALQRPQAPCLPARQLQRQQQRQQQQQRQGQGHQQQRQGLMLVGQRPRSSVVSMGMYVPSDSFGGMSPERRAAQSMETFFTFVAAKVVMSQLEGIGRGDLGSYNAEAMGVLRHFLLEEPMRDANAWLAKLTEQNEMLGVRIMEVRLSYAKEDFEWQNLQRLAVKGLADNNTKLLRQHASTRFTAMLDAAGEEQ